MGSTLLSLPRSVLESVLSYLSFDEISKIRETCKTFDDVCGDILNRGFRHLERKLATCQAALRTKLPRRESERRTHPLSRHCEVLSAVETRLSLLKMSIMRYVDDGHCCFFAGKVLDEINRVYRSVQLDSDIPDRPYTLLNEMRDVSSMAIEHFEDVLLPLIRRRISSAAVHTETWHPSSSTSSFVPNSSIHNLASSSGGNAFIHCPEESTHSETRCMALERRVKRLEQANLISRSRMGASLRALSQLFIRLRETSEQNKRLGALITAQTRRIQHLESLVGPISSMNGNLDSPCTGSSAACEGQCRDGIVSYKRPRSALTNSLSRMQPTLRTHLFADKRARKMERYSSTPPPKDD